MGSSIIYGQKRVGKTSIVKTFANRLEKDFPREFSVIYLEGGEYVCPDPVRTIESLGRKLCECIRSTDSRWESVDSPQFEGALAPLGDFVNHVLEIAPERKLILILDEFDELPTDLYTHNAVADSFFLSIRSLSAKPRVGFVLVGGEKIPAILGFQGHELNKFKTMRVDYFDRQQHWGDFVDLVRKPAQQVLEVSDRAINALYEYTAGNPYFTKLLCKSLFTAMVSRRDGHVTESEVAETVRTELRNVGVNSFLHFWDDGIVEKGEERQRITATRQKILLCWAEVARRSRFVSMEQIRFAAKGLDIPEDLADQEVEDFIQRNVMLRDDWMLRVKVGFFAEWLRDNGPRELLPRLGERITTLERKREESAYVRDEELRSLVERWQVYKGRRIGADDFRRWLIQFESNVDQRLMFKLISNLRYFSEDQIRQHLANLQKMVSREVGSRFEGKVPRIHDVLVSYLDAPGKSGFQYAKLYGEENKIYHEKIQEPARALKVARSDDTIKAIVFVDDFLGTGESAIAYLKRIKDDLCELQKTRTVAVYISAICGFQSAAARIENEMQEADVRVSARIADPLSLTDRAFSPEGGIFSDPDERERAKRIVRNYGLRLEPKHPLGYRNSEALVAFERSCPNNTLPIIWASSKDWVPLLKRL